MKKIFQTILIALALQLTSTACVTQQQLKVDDPAPLFSAKTHEGKDFELKSRSGQWTVLYFYPKANTPGCTKQACAFRDNIKKIRAEGAEVYGISSDDVAAQAKFHQDHELNFDLLADPAAQVITMYGTKMPGVNLAKRWTFIISPELKISKIDHDVDPIIDSVKIAADIASLKKGQPSPHKS